MDSSIARVESSSSSSPNIKWSYDVFLSFRGEDTRDNFTSHLDMALRQKGVNFFIDDKLDRGGQISESLLRSIQSSRISIIIFSKNYASSTWCLDELVKIIECMKSKRQLLLPVFYKVDPSEVRKQTGGFGEALAKHEANQFMTNKIQPWKEALTIAAGLSGWDLATRKDEADLIQEIVKQVLSLVNRTQLLNVAKHPVGVDSQLRLIEELVSHVVSADDVNMVGIHGMGGIGKTTLAKALYNKIAYEFEGCCFISNVREASEPFNGLVQLQEKLLYEILKDDLKVGSVDRGMNIIKDRLGSKKVLIVLDDVDKLDQLEALVGEHDWFSQGSRIIVTTRNNHLLVSHGFDGVHAMQGLHSDDALELFSWHAFKQNHPPIDYLTLSKQATKYCNELPLALVILGSLLHKREQIMWKSKLDELENSMEPGIEAVLQISFKGLQDREKEIFLDISCFFVGWDVNYIKNVLKACDLNPDYAITILMDFSLVTVENGKIQMHDLIRQMGQSFTLRESSKPEKRSRLWAEEAMKLLEENTGTDAIRAIKVYDYQEQIFIAPRLARIEAERFRNMKSLKFLILQDVRLPRDMFEYLPNQLKWIECSQFAFQPPYSSSLIVKGQLVGLVMKDEHFIFENYSRRIIFENCRTLKHVDMSYCDSLIEIFNFNEALNLEKLYLRGCRNLKMIHESVASLSKLITLDLEGCTLLEEFPNSFHKFKSLEVLNLSGCTRLKEITDLSASSNFKELYLRDHIFLSIGRSLANLVALDLEGCMYLEMVPSYLNSESLEFSNHSQTGKLENVFENPLKSFPSHLKLKLLKVLKLSSCQELVEITDLSIASNLEVLDLSNCRNLRRIHESVGSLNKLITLNLQLCHGLKKLPRYLRLKSLDYLSLSCCSKLEQLPEFGQNMISLREMNLNGMSISGLPSSIGYLIGLENLDLRKCENLIALPSVIHLLKGLKQLNLCGCSRLDMFPLRTELNFPQQSLCSKLIGLILERCNILDANFLETLSDVSTSLKILDLSGNKFSCLPSLQKFTSLRYLQLRNCKFLKDITKLPNCLKQVNVIGCESLVISPDYIAEWIFGKQDLELNGTQRELIVTNSEIPKYCNNQTTKSSSVILQEHNKKNETVPALVVCVIFKVVGEGLCEIFKTGLCEIFKTADGDELDDSLHFDVSIDGYYFMSSMFRSSSSSKSEHMLLLRSRPIAFSYLNMDIDQHNIEVSCTNANVVIRSQGVYLVLTS